MKHRSLVKGVLAIVAALFLAGCVAVPVGPYRSHPWSNCYCTP